MTTFNLLRNEALNNCKDICRITEIHESFHKEKYNEIIKITESANRLSMHLLTPLDWATKVYNNSVAILKHIKKSNA